MGSPSLLEAVYYDYIYNIMSVSEHKSETDKVKHIMSVSEHKSETDKVKHILLIFDKYHLHAKVRCQSVEFAKSLATKHATLLGQTTEPAPPAPPL